MAVSRLAYAHPGGDLLFSEVSFRVSPGQHVGLVGANRGRKEHLLWILAGALAPDEGEASVGGITGYVSQDVGVGDGGRTVRELLLLLAPRAVPGADIEEDDRDDLARSRGRVRRGLDDCDAGGPRGDGAWVHGGSYATYAQAREERQRRLGSGQALAEEERRLFRLMKTFKERAHYAPDWAERADAMESRWRRFRAGGPPPSPVADAGIAVGIRGSDSARVVLDLRSLGIAGLVSPFSDRGGPFCRAGRGDRTQRIGQERTHPGAGWGAGRRLR